MPSLIIGGIKILSVSSGSNIQFGDTALINLTSNCKVYSGANSFSPGDAIASPQNYINGGPNTVDPDVIDMPAAGTQL
ncbi:spore germination protein [Gorillibacterium sp. sgz500922]|uniref:spore germination protein n=1 Tax=Gorillibacterium sp. sgz500922 TaxID=3446694 RepID=UPI003F67C96F